MTRHSDHPLVRRDLNCPLCNGYKSGGKVLCDECHVDVASSSSEWASEAEDRIDAAERQLEMNEAWGIW